MRRLLTGALFALIALSASMLMTGVTEVRAAGLCTDGQSMEGRNACTCRPPLKYLPGNICGSGKKVTAPQQAGGNTSIGGTTCQEGMNAQASGCVCRAPLTMLPGGRCGKPGTKVPMGVEGKPIFKQRACERGRDIKATNCVCQPPMRTIRREIARTGGRAPFVQFICGGG